MNTRQSLLTLSVLAVSFAGCSTVPPKPAASSEKDVAARVEALLDRYAANDQKGVIAMLDPNRITIFGSDLKEVVKTHDAVSRLMSDDFALWHSAKFSDVRDMDVRMSDRMATTFFVASFYPGGSPNPVPVRFAMTWRNANGQWLLTQSANSVPTVGQSAAEILGRQ